MTTFISYRRKTAEDVAGRIYNSLVGEFGREGVFMDVYNLRKGIEFHDQLLSALVQCKVVVAVIGKDWTEAINTPTNFVRIELEVALRRGIRIIPVLVHETPIPDSFPTSLSALAALEFAKLDSGADYYHHFERLVEDIRLAHRQSGGASIVRRTLTLFLPNSRQGDEESFPPITQRRWSYWGLILAMAVAGVTFYVGKVLISFVKEREPRQEQISALLTTLVPKTIDAAASKSDSELHSLSEVSRMPILLPRDAQSSETSPSPPGTLNSPPIPPRGKSPTASKAQELARQGKASMILGRFQQAANEYEEAYRLSLNSDLLVNLGQAYRLAGDYSRAEHFYQTYLKLVPHSPYQTSIEVLISKMHTAPGDASVPSESSRSRSGQEP